MQKIKRTNSKKSLYFIGSLLIITSLSIIFIHQYNKTVNIQVENEAIEEFYKQETKVEFDSTKVENNSTETKTKKEESNLYEYIAILRIPKINLKRGLVDKNSKYNDIKYNIMIHKSSDNPSEEGGNLILLAHSGNSNISFFKNLYKMKLDDIIYLDYNNNTYKYKLINIYDIEKNGKAPIRKNTTKSSITLITCRNNTNKQIVLIGELIASY